MPKDATKQSPPPQVAPPPVERPSGARPNPPILPEQEWLDELERLLIRMLIGVFKFPFVRLPAIIYDWWNALFPTIVQLTRILLLVVTLFVFVFGPAVYAFYHQDANGLIRQHLGENQALSILESNPTVVKSVSYCWSFLALVGAVWGAVYVRRKRRRMRSG